MPTPEEKEALIARILQEGEAWRQARYYGLLRPEQPARSRVHGLDLLFSDSVAPAIPRLIPMLEDEAPVLVGDARSGSVIEVRFRVLSVLERLYRVARQAPDCGPVRVREAMRAADAVSLAHRTIEGLPPERQRALVDSVDRWLALHVKPDPKELEPLRAYRALQELGLVAYRTEEIDLATLLTPLQLEVHESQVGRPRPAPSLRVSLKTRPQFTLGWVTRSPKGRIAFDFAEDDLSQVAREDAIRVLGDGGRVPFVVHDEAGRPCRNADRTFRIEGDLPPDTDRVADYLRSVAAFIADDYAVALSL